MADEADERSALLHNGHADGEPKVSFHESGFPIPILPILAPRCRLG